MMITLVMNEALLGDIASLANLPEETAGVLLASVVEAPNGDIRVLGREIRWVEESAYARRESDSLLIHSDGYIQALAEGERVSATCIWVHTHPGKNSSPRPSSLDLEVDHQIAELFRIRSGSPFYGAVIFSPVEGGLSFTGHLQLESGHKMFIDRMWSVGGRWHLTPTYDCDLQGLEPKFDRNVRAFGPVVQRTLGELRVSVVGCGGTGSAVAEQLVRLGVRNFTLIDPDRLSESNVTRVYGSSLFDVGRPKAQILAEHINRISPDASCRVVVSMITKRDAAEELIASDVVFGCTDDNAGRLVLSRFSSYMLTPVIDCGVLISSDVEGRISGIDGRVTTLTYGNACLVCRGRIDLARASAEMLSPSERQRRIDEGYAPALGQTEPAVVAFTSLVASAAVSELLERLIGFGGGPAPGELLLRAHDREISTNNASPSTDHYCDPSSGKVGIGKTDPFLEQTWHQ